MLNDIIKFFFFFFFFFRILKRLEIFLVIILNNNFSHLKNVKNSHQTLISSSAMYVNTN
jgi:hypothetical protein